ncbi:ABC transporter ATP-binding protein [Salinibacterium sp. NSLL150]|uniref:dipeptide ABC transporter ATP-binding protein n=1 Tax=unclassified Salinibacterium TaxID=2632331 RepID=UPI0018CF2720|nr:MULTISPECIES: ABC transporter ATP-binding protein [unclassified Salinibacterium]MBH0099888.1 ABC transporter ATP-binding protein [Salinibacterium sp. NSLL35]MBH0102642.1 ABC transporter ATP-binding protein [Salinibacterium sp. NSLL150]MBH0105402.1 ABC transporter ATP-binding protein [Salinibacterium sp. NSLL16]MBH0108162.1 ABC transporter ATP-binding protein [Salinibacterium sp. NSLL17]
MIEQKTDDKTAANDNILVVRDLHVSYATRSGSVAAVRGISFVVPRGKIVAIVGESGSGKSTTSQALIRRLASGGRIDSGSIEFEGRDLGPMSERELRSIRGGRIGFVPQDPSKSLNPLMRVGDQISEALRLHLKLDKAAAAAEAVRILDEVGLPDPEARATQFPHELSGGMRQRVLIGIAWACNPQLVIADEPTSALDVTVQRHVLDNIDELVRRHNTSVVLVTHDLAVAADRADYVAVMSNGEIVEQGTTAQVLSAPTHEYTKKLVESAPGLASRRLTPSLTALGEQQQSSAGKLFTHTRPAQPAGSATASGAAAVAADSGADAAGATNILEVSNLVKTFALRRQGGGSQVLRAVDDVSFVVPRGSTFSIVGESGSGKTTTARIAARIASADSGTVSFDGTDVTSLSGEALRQLRRRVQVVYQNPFGSLDPKMSIERIIAEPLRAFRVGDRTHRAEMARELLEHVSLSPSLAQRRPTELSGGQRQRVAIARSLAIGPELIVLDEPVSALDVSVQEQILQLLVDLQVQFGLSYLFISHDLGVIRQISDHIAVMRSGKVLEAGTAHDVMSNPQHEYTRELLEAIPGQRAV